ncbi:MAG: hypothetical protein HN700_15585, partial [Verrucomicrobia bacterium]|nr:hypothetical protein [Verrucomicrobiota bacterium]
MLETLLNLKDSQQIIGFDLIMRGSMALLGIFILGAIVYTVFQYRSLRSIPSKGRKIMGTCHLLALLIIVFMIAMPAAKIRYTKTYRPTMLMLVDTSRSMAAADKRATAESLAEAARIMDGLAFDKDVAEDLIQQYLKKAPDISRLDLVKALFEHPDIDLLRRAGERFDVRFFSFDQSLTPEGGAEDPSAWLGECNADGEASRIGTAIREAVSRYTGLQIAGVMVFSDFGWVDGENPARVAGSLATDGIPVYPVPIGMPAPPDAMIREIIGPEAIFDGDPVMLRVRLQSRGFDGRSTTLKLKVNGAEAQSESLVLDEGTQFAEMRFEPKQRAGELQLEFELDGMDIDSNLKNNVLSHRLRIIEEKIKVLYVEGSPRWEFRYLRWVLMRNTHLKTRFLMTKGDPRLPEISPRFMAEFPKNVRNIFEYDLIIIGDVSSKYFKPEQLELLEKQIRVHGGSLIMLAGPLAAPASYQNTPVASVLPVTIGAGKPHDIADNLFPRLPEGELHSPITVLDDAVDANQRLWSKVRPMHRLPALGGAKPSANVLLHLPGTLAGMDYPVVSWHNYGKGKCMFVATDRLWRLRLETGDEHHGRFWGQAIQFLAMSRVLGQNRRISLQTERARYNPGEPVRVYANVLSAMYEPVVKESHTLVMERDGFADSARELLLLPDPGTPGLYFGAIPAGPEGDYKIRAQDHELEHSGTAAFIVASDPIEDRDTAARPDIAEAVANASGTAVVAPADLA